MLILYLDGTTVNQIRWSHALLASHYRSPHRIPSQFSRIKKCTLR